MMLMLAFILSCPYLAVSDCNVRIISGAVVCDCSRITREKLIYCPTKTNKLNIRNSSIGVLQDYFFYRFAHLIYLSIDTCGIKEIKPLAFTNLSKLERLRIIYNPITYFNSSVFSSLSSLKEIWISHDLLSSYPTSSKSDVSSLVNVYTYGGPSNQRFGNVFSFMLNLKRLNHFDQCSLKTLRNETFQAFSTTPLETLELTLCAIRHVEIDAFLPLKHLKNLRMPGQHFMKLSNTLYALHAFKDRHMDVVDLGFEFRSYGEYIISAKLMAYIGNICIKSLSLAGNKLRVIDGSGLLNMKYKCFENMDLSGNNFNSIQIWNLWYSTLFTHLKRIDISRMDGTLKYNKLLRHHGFKDPLISKKLTKQWTFRFPDSLIFVNMSLNSNHLGAPPDILSFVAKRLQTLDIAGTSFNSCNFIFEAPMSVQVLNISRWRCQNLNVNLISTFQGLKHLQMQSSFLNVGIGRSHNKSFLIGLRQLEYIDFSQNGFNEDFETIFFRDQSNTLRRLILRANDLRSIPLSVSSFQNLQLLDLAYNRIPYLKTNEINAIDIKQDGRPFSNFSLRLEGNPFVCDCSSVSFVKWIVTTDVQLDNKGNYSCTYVDGSVRSIIDIAKNIRVLQIHCMMDSMLNIAIICIILLLFSISACAAYRHRWNIQFWYYKMSLPVSHERQKCNHDIFMVYAEYNSDWVIDSLQYFLETIHQINIHIPML